MSEQERKTLRVSRDSWHYKMAIAMENHIGGSWIHNGRISLCAYFWTIVLYTIFAVPIYSVLIWPAVLVMGARENIDPRIRIGISLTLLALFLTINPFVISEFSPYIEDVITYPDGDSLILNNYGGFLLLISIVFGILSFAALCFDIKDTIWYYLDKRPKREMTREEIDAYFNKKPKEPNVVKEFLKAKKNKYCPMLEFTKDD